VPSVCVDVDADGVQDILLSTFDGHLALYNGKTLKPIWIADFHGMQSYRLMRFMSRYVCCMTRSESMTVHAASIFTGQGKLEKVRGFEWSGKGQGKIFFFGKVMENEKFLPPDVRFSG